MTDLTSPSADSRQTAPDTNNIKDALERTIFTMVVLFLGIVIGALVITYKLPTYDTLRRAFVGYNALIDRYWITNTRGPYARDSWTWSRHEESGVLRHDAQLAYAGATLYTSGHAPVASLVSMTGEVLHEWSLPFREAWPVAPQVANPVPENQIAWRAAHVYPNGDLLTLYIGLGDTPYGYGLIKFDRQSTPIWRYDANAHHDFDIAEDGRIYVLTHEIREEPVDRLESVRPPILEDFIAVLSPDGQELKKLSLVDALMTSHYGRLISAMGDEARGDLLHANSVDVLDEEMASAFTFAEPGQVLISLRRPNALILVDVDTEEVVWAQTGYWHQQHDAEFLPNGRILLFDNKGHYEEGGPSRILEIDPDDLSIDWSYGGSREERFYSRIRSRQQRLPNGNTLITESDGARLLEVTPNGEIAWEFVNPVRAQDRGLTAVIMGGHRYAMEELPFLR